MDEAQAPGCPGPSPDPESHAPRPRAPKPIPVVGRPEEKDKMERKVIPVTE